MEKYIERNLLKNEKIIYETHRSLIIFIQPVLWLLIMVSFWFIQDLEKLSWLFFILAIITGINSLINYWLSEIAVTNMRVLIKMGLFTVRSMETNLQNIASIEIEQTLLGKFLNYGTMVIRDTGSTRSAFQYIDEPFSFRKAVYTQIDQRYPAPEQEKDVK